MNHQYIDYFLNGTGPGAARGETGDNSDSTPDSRPIKAPETDDHTKPEPMPTEGDKAVKTDVDYVREWREKNRDHYNETMRQWRENNREKLREYKREYMKAYRKR